MCHPRNWIFNCVAPIQCQFLRDNATLEWLHTSRTETSHVPLTFEHKIEFHTSDIQNGWLKQDCHHLGLLLHLEIGEFHIWMCGRSQRWAVIGLWVQRMAKHLASKLTAVGYGTLAVPTTLWTFLLKTRTNQTEMDIRADWIPVLYPCSLLFESRGSAHLFRHSMKWTKCNIFVEWAVGVRVERVLVKLLSTQAPLRSRWHFQQHPPSFSHVPVFPRSTARLTASLMRAQSVSTIHTCAPQAGRLACKLMPWTYLFFFYT